MGKKLIALAVVVTTAFVWGCADRSPLDPGGAAVDGDPIDTFGDQPIDPRLLNVEKTSARIGDFGTGVNAATDAAGLREGAATVSVNVPVQAAEDILEAYFYWGGRTRRDFGDDTIVINGSEVTGDLTAAFPHSITPTRWAFLYKLDALSLVAPGDNTFEVSGFDLGENANEDGIGLVVVYRDASGGYDEVQILELADFFYHAAPETGANSDVHAFTFDAAEVELDAALQVFVGDGNAERPDAIWWSIGAGEPAENLVGSGETLANVLNAADGAEMDLLTLEPTIPAGANHIAFQFESPVEGDGDSGLIMAAVFCLNSTIENLPPACDAGGEYAGEAGVELTFDGSGSSDSDGEILAWSWDFGDGNTATGEMVTHTYAEAGEYTVTLCVTDDGRLESCCTATAIVEAAEVPIECDAGGPYEAIAGVPFTLDASGSVLPDGDFTFAWELAGQSYSGETVEVTVAEPGEYTVELCILEVEVERGDEGEEPVCCSADVLITPDSGVACDAGGPYEGVEGSPVTFDGTGSSGGESLFYAWNFGDGSFGQGAIVDHVYLEPGEYDVELCVYPLSSDGGRTWSEGDEEDCCFTTAVISAAPNVAPDCDAGDDYSGLVGDEVPFDGSGSGDTDGVIVSWEWDFGDGTTGSGETTSHVYVPAPAQAGAGYGYGYEYTVTLTVTDDDGEESSCTTLVYLEEDFTNGEPPICDAGLGYEDLVGSNVRFDGSNSSDPDGQVVQYEWDFGDGTAVLASNQPTILHSYDETGDYTVTLTVYDDAGNSSSCTALVSIYDDPLR